MSELDKKLFKAIDDLIAMNWGEIQKHKMSVTFPSITHQFRVDAAQLLSDWAISAPGGWRWPEWLICNWDPEKEEFPPFDLEPADPVSYTHLRAHETVLDLVCRLLLEKKKDLLFDNLLDTYHTLHHILSHQCDQESTCLDNFQLH